MQRRHFFYLILLLILSALSFRLLDSRKKENSSDIALNDPGLTKFSASSEQIFSMHLPSYEGVDQLLVLSNRWVIVVTTNTKEVLDKIDELSDGQFYEAVKKWTMSEKNKNYDWGARDTKLRLFNQYFAQARLLVDEKDLGTPQYFSITSSNDSNYSEPQFPKRATIYYASLDKEQISGEYEVHYGIYSYLELPEPLKNGEEYTIVLKNGKRVTFLYNELRTVSRAIKVNQMGYLPACDQKFAYVGCYLQEFGPMDLSLADTFSVVSTSTGNVVLEGKIKLRSSNPRLAFKPDEKETSIPKSFLTGENTYEMDLSSLKEEGEFFISIPSVGRSWPFRHAHDVYGEAFYTSIRGLYHQRCGVEIGLPYTPWPRIKCHTAPVYESEDIPFVPPIEKPANYEAFDVIGATIDYQRSHSDATGGWHDAADWDKNIFHYYIILDLLHAYELKPHKFFDGQLNIPESGNGIPDILDEVEYGLKVWTKSLTGKGGAAGTLETWTHPTIDDPKYKYAYSLRTRWASLMYAGAAAHYAHLVRPFDSQRADDYLQSALRAYAFGSNIENSLNNITIHAAKNRGQGEKYELSWTEKEEYNIPFLIYANLRLFIDSDDKSFLKDLPKMMKKSPKPYDWPFSYKDFSPWLYHGIFNDKVSRELPTTLLKEWKSHYVNHADRLIQLIPTQPYRQSWPNYQDYWMAWGATTMTNQARALLIAHQLTGQKSYYEAAVLNTDYMLGVNAMGMSWTTSLGSSYPISIQHAVSEDDGILDPVPGITIYGPTGGMFHQLKTMIWETPTPNGAKEKFLKAENWEVPVFRQWSCHPHLNTPQCEFTVSETMSSTAFATAMLMNDDWKPSDELKKRLPKKEDLLFGYWYLP